MWPISQTYFPAAYLKTLVRCEEAHIHIFPYFQHQFNLRAELVTQSPPYIHYHTKHVICPYIYIFGPSEPSERVLLRYMTCTYTIFGSWHIFPSKAGGKF